MHTSQELSSSKSISSTFSLLPSKSSNTCLTPSSSQYLTPTYIQDELKRRMQTTVAVLEANPHKFKILPLKHVPAAQRPYLADSPSMNFDRPYVGWRPEVPSIYQLPPSRTGSTYSFHSAMDDGSTLVRILDRARSSIKHNIADQPMPITRPARQICGFRSCAL